MHSFSLIPLRGRTQLRTAIGSNGGGGRRQPLLDTGTVGTGGGGGQGLADYWNQLNPCEKKVAFRFPLSGPAVKQARDAAEKVATDLGEGDNNYANAVKHCTWSCIMTIKLGTRIAKAWGDAHECDENGKMRNDASSRRDLHNNKVGRTIGDNLGSSGSDQACVTRCKASRDIDFEGPRPTGTD